MQDSVSGGVSWVQRSEGGGAQVPELMEEGAGVRASCPRWHSHAGGVKDQIQAYFSFITLQPQAPSHEENGRRVFILFVYLLAYLAFQDSFSV